MCVKLKPSIETLKNTRSLGVRGMENQEKIEGLTVNKFNAYLTF